MDTVIIVLYSSLPLKRAPSGRDPRLRGKVILHVKQTMMIIHQKNLNNYHVCYVYIIAHLYGSVSYNHEKVNFTRTEIPLSTKVKL